MPSYEHEKLVEHIAALSSPPQDDAQYAAWLTASGQLRLLRENAQEQELIVSAIGPRTFVHTRAVSEDELFPLDKSDLLSWSVTLSHSRAGYVWGGGSDDVRTEETGGDWKSKSLARAVPLVFSRQLHGFGDDDGVYFELLQEYAHITEIHWRADQRAYCCFDGHGDIEHVVSATAANTKGTVSLVSFQREQLEQYLAASNSVLVRMFDFTLVDWDSRGFSGWSEELETEHLESDDLFFRQKIDPDAAYTRGIQIVRPSRPKHEIMQDIRFPERKYTGDVEFIVQDFRNQCIATVSTDPSATTNYYESKGNSLPLEMSPAFFRPEVLVKYKGDREKYTVSEERRTIGCRGGWSLRSYDINDAGQVHAYIVDLRALPYQEQLYWQSFNEQPKSSISERSFVNDFKGEWADLATPLEDLLAALRQWARSGMSWWTLRDDALLERVNTPRANSREEWARAFHDLANLVVEGFVVRAIRGELHGLSIAFGETEKSLALLERLLRGRQALSEEAKLDALRAVQEIRSVVAAHPRGSRAIELAQAARTQHGTYAAHFESVCTSVTDELRMIEAAFA